jgi:epoxyqueuosine reductase
MPDLLIHVCCAPCLVAPYFQLRENFNLRGFWYNPNIHPYTEYKKRMSALENFAAEQELEVIYKDEYNLEEFLRRAVYRENNRCEQCYYDRLKYTAIIARKGKFDYFTSTLLYSKYQDHEKIREIGESLAQEYKIKFYYEDLRKYWSDGIRISKEKGMYRQQYCGCIYSEKERYLGKQVPLTPPEALRGKNA